MNMKKIFLVSLAGFLFSVSDAFAVAASYGYSESLQRMKLFHTMASEAIQAILVDPDLNIFIDNIWACIAFFYLTKIVTRWVFNRHDDYDLVYALVVLILTRTMMVHYDYITSLCWDWSEGLASGMQLAVIGETDPFFLNAFMSDTMSAITYTDVNIFSKAIMYINALIMSLVIMVLAAMSFFNTMWAVYGYALSKMIGWMFIPFVMLERTAFLFEGWLRLFFGFLLYGVIARANMLLVALGIRCYFGLPGFKAGALPIKIYFTAGSDIWGFLAFMLVALCALFSTGRFAAAMASGVGVGGAFQSIAMAVTRIMIKK